MFTPAFAQAAAGAQAGNPFQMLLPFVLIAVVFYFLLIRPQQKRVKEHKALISSVRRGDTIITSGGLIGKVTKVIEDADEVEIDLGGDVKARVVRSMIADVRGKTQPVKAEKSEPAKKSKKKAADAANAPAKAEEGETPGDETK